MRDPVRTLSATASIVIVHSEPDGSPCTSEKSQWLGAADDARLDGILIKKLETRAFLSSQRVLDIIPQIARPHRLSLRGGREILARNVVGVLQTAGTRLLQGADVMRRQGALSPGPERIDERQAGGTHPDLAEIDFLDRGVAIPDERVVANDQRGVTGRKHLVEIRTTMFEFWLNVEHALAEHARERNRRPRAGIEGNRADVLNGPASVDGH